MTGGIEYLLNKASAAEIAEHLSNCDADFIPPLTGRVDINDYAKKIVSKAIRFEAWANGSLIGLIAAYCNDHERNITYITNVSVVREWMGKGIAACLMNRCLEHAKASGMREISLDVAADNTPAIKLYEKNGFTVVKMKHPFVTMNLHFRYGEERD